MLAVREITDAPYEIRYDKVFFNETPLNSSCEFITCAPGPCPAAPGSSVASVTCCFCTTAWSLSLPGAASAGGARAAFGKQNPPCHARLGKRKVLGFKVGARLAAELVSSWDRRGRPAREGRIDSSSFLRQEPPRKWRRDTLASCRGHHISTEAKPRSAAPWKPQGASTSPTSEGVRTDSPRGIDKEHPSPGAQRASP